MASKPCFRWLFSARFWPVFEERKEVLGKFGAPAKGHPAWNPHPIQGWTPNFIPKVTEDGMAMNLADEIMLVDPVEAMKTSTQLARRSTRLYSNLL